MENNLSKKEILLLFYGDEKSIIDPDFQWKNNIESLGLNPEEYIVEKETMDIINIHDLHNALYRDEIKSLKETIAQYKQKIYGSLTLSDYMIAPNSYDFYGEPKNRSEAHFFKLLNATEWANINAFDYAKILAQGDSKQPLNTEELIHLHSKYDPIIIDEKNLSHMTDAGITIHEWERSMILKSLLKYQKELNTEIPNHKELLLSDSMPKKFTYGQCIIYNNNTKKYCKDGLWLEKHILV